MKTITLAITGASGVQYATRLLECLLASDIRVNLLISRAAQVVFRMETEMALPSRPEAIHRYFVSLYGCEPSLLRVYGHEQWAAPVASGTGVADAMIVCPCTTGTLSAIACGSSNNLIERAADVTLKERKPFIVLPREMPLSAIHLEHMLKLSQLGVVIMPPNPGFYQRPETVDDIIDFIVSRILDQLSIPHQLLPRWGEE